MSFHAMAWASKQKVGGVTGKAILLMLEATINGAVTVRSLDDVCRILECNPRTLRNGLKKLRESGFVTVARSPTVVEIGCEIGTVTLHPFDGQDRPVGWDAVRARVFREKGLACFYCDEVATQVDHVLARTCGGSDEFDNLVPCCGPCNLSKGNRTLDSWRGRS